MSCGGSPSPGDHSLIRIWSGGAWWLACSCCPYRLFESEPTHPQEGEQP